MKKILILAICLILMLAQNAYAIKIYQYSIGKNPDCINLGGRYFDSENKTIGFGTNETILSKDCAELTEAEFLNYCNNAGYGTESANKLLRDKKYQTRELSSSNDFTGTFLGKNIYSKKDVEVIVSEKIIEMQGGQQVQFKNIGEMLALLLAYQGKIPFNQCGIGGVVDIASADVYISTLFIDFWKKRNDLRDQAKQFILDNNLK